MVFSRRFVLAGGAGVLGAGLGGTAAASTALAADAGGIDLGTQYEVSPTSRVRR